MELIKPNSFRDKLGIIFLIFLFFSGFNILEASQPSLASRMSPPDSRGAVLGVYNTLQSLGIFAGGAMLAHPAIAVPLELGAIAARAGATKMRKNEISKKQSSYIKKPSSIIYNYIICLK